MPPSVSPSERREIERRSDSSREEGEVPKDSPTAETESSDA